MNSISMTPEQLAPLVKINADGKALAASERKYAGVLQTKTGLVWDPRERKSMTHAEAEKYIAELNAKEPDLGWRLPTVDELFALASRTKYAPAIDKVFFPKCQRDWYWTSSPAAYSPTDCAWIVNFNDGNSNWFSRDLRTFVRAVRPVIGVNS